MATVEFQPDSCSSSLPLYILENIHCPGLLACQFCPILAEDSAANVMANEETVSQNSTVQLFVFTQT
jgi:hypothetical protein